jgi:hypothetical protein
MIGEDTFLVKLVSLVDRLPRSSGPVKRGRGRPLVYSEHLFIKALVIMVIRHLHTVHELLSVLDQENPEIKRLRKTLYEHGRFPSRRTFERRLSALPESLPSQIGALGRHLVFLICPYAHCGRAASIDSTPLRARGGVWHKKHREEGLIPHTSIDTEAHWTKSGWHGFVYGWKLHIIVTVADVWIPLAADLTSANVDDGKHALVLLPEMSHEVRYVLGDQHYNRDQIRAVCHSNGQELVATQFGPYPHTDDGVNVRRVFHALRSHAIENFNEQFKSIFDGHGQVPTKGWNKTARFALGAVLVYQLVLWYRFEHGLSLREAIKAFIKAA